MPATAPPRSSSRQDGEATAKANTAGSSSNPLSGVIDDLKTMFEMLKAVAKGAYRRKETLILVAGAATS